MTIITGPDLLNFKKGWMTRLGEDGKWRKHWFVLTEQTLRFYRDSIAEEAADVDGEINLSTCFDITDFPVQRNYGFQIHTKDGVFTLCAMTYGIRRNWIQAVMKNVRPVVPPDVAPLNSAPRPKSHSSSNTSCSEVEKRSRISERRKEGRYKTFDWAEFRHRQQKREESNRQFQRGSEVACLPPAPAWSPEEPGAMVLSEEPTERGMPYNQQRMLMIELQNQLEESDSEVARMQARLRNEETLYYNMEHDYEQVCEELECARGALQNCETMCEDRYRAQLEQQQREINRKEQELQEMLVKMATCELGFSSMEQSHQRVIEEMQRQHHIEVDRLTEEREKVLQEETNATIAAIDAMRKAHKEELEKSQKAQQSGANTDISKLRAQFDEELESLHRELEVLSEQYSQKCLENAHLSRKIETERQALSSTERENQELHIHNQELNKRLVAELSLMQSYMNGGVDHAQLPQGKDIYQLEVTLRVKESEIQCLRQEISSLKEELQAANRVTHFCLISCFTIEWGKCSLRDGLSAQERIKLFESEDNRKI
uniref:Si:ch211-23l10.3 n=1 Tax=Astyanax mexicanus TaxID=7994 RepID=A0A3B1JZU6_ASTMX